MRPAKKLAFASLLADRKSQPADFEALKPRGDLKAALDSGILKTATDNGRGTLEKLLEGLGFESVVIR